MTGGGICETKTFHVNVSGTRIRKVVFSIDNKKVLTLTAPNRGKNVFSLKVTPSKLARGAHRASAVVSFRAVTKKKDQRFARRFAVGTLLNGTPCRGISPEPPSG
jgi:hypothetical protein